MYGQPTDFTEIECWNEAGDSTQYWLREDELQTLIERIQSLAEHRAQTNKYSTLHYTEQATHCTEHPKLHYPER